MEKQVEVTNPIRVVRQITLPQSEIEKIIICPISGQIYHTPYC